MSRPFPKPRPCPSSILSRSLADIGRNVNTRLEPTAFIAPAVCRLLTFRDLSFYSHIFFELVDPIYRFIDQQKFLDQCAQYWTAEKDLLQDIEAVVCGVVALGSFFADKPSPVESSLVEHAKQVLDIGCAYAPGRVSLTQIAGWALRTLYLRLTTRPHLSWYSSCSTMHVAEAIGLHVNLEDVEIITGDSTEFIPELTSSRSDLFECAVFINMIISAEYGRSRVILQGGTEPKFESTSKLAKLTAIMVRIESSLTQEARMNILSTLQDLPGEPMIFILLKTDVTIHLFRRHLHLYQDTLGLPESTILLSIIKTGLSAIRSLVPQRQAWWNVLSTPFQSLMVLLAMDTDDSLSMVEETFSVLSLVYNTFPTHLAGEVVQTAQTLIQGLQKRKTRQAEMLNKAYTNNQSTIETPSCYNSSSGLGQAVDQAEVLFDSWLAGDASWSWLPTDTIFEQTFDANADAFGLG